MQRPSPAGNQPAASPIWLQNKMAAPANTVAAKKKILLVDDTAANLDCLRLLLETVGFDVVTASDGIDAMALLEQEKVDAIISDILMPNMDGYRLCEMVRHNSRLSQIPFIVYTGTFNTPNDKSLAMNLGADKYLTKPASISQIIGAIDEVLKKKKKQRRKQAPPAQAAKEMVLVKYYNEALVQKLEQKNVELSAQARALALSEERFKELADNINEIFWITDLALKETVYISPAYERIFGRTCQSLYDKPKSFIDSIHPEDRARVKAAMAQAARGRLYDIEYRIIRPDGDLRWIHDRGSAVRNSAGEMYRLAGIAEDITHRKELEAQFRQAQKMEAIGKLAGGVAHDFNNLLMIMGGSVELLQWEEPNLSVPAKVYLAEIAAAAVSAAGLTRQLLTFSRTNAMKVEPLNLNDIIGGFTRMLRRIVGEQIQVKTDFDPALPLIEADTGMFEQVLMNLVINARDAMPKGGSLVITTSVETVDQERADKNASAWTGKFVCLSVRDTGEGIPPENLPCIFEPFFTTKKAGQGTGLGLATVSGIVGQHRGWIEVASELGRGTTFRILLPKAGDTTLRNHRKIEEKACRGTETILLVEDEPDVLELCQLGFQHYGYTVLTANSAAAAQKVWAEHGPKIKLLFTDMIMPGGTSGLELAQMLRQQQPALKVVLASGYSPKLTEAYLGVESLNFLQKPFSPRAATELVRTCLDTK